jgi:hypothetical protein
MAFGCPMFKKKVEQILGFYQADFGKEDQGKGRCAPPLAKAVVASSTHGGNSFFCPPITDISLCKEIPNVVHWDAWRRAEASEVSPMF